ncbi:MAG: hypothetical protein KDH94_09095, partial [Coxiellaceae bacterium]|nr:hypothetical protein [Coxiellaceae bacterium]
CIEKGNVYSEAPYYGVFTDTTTEKLENLAKESAFRLGASYVVLDKPVEKGRTITMQGKAYTCP